jgi:hypothetical protein
MADIALNWQNKLEINVNPGAGAPKWVQIKNGFKNIAQAINEVVYQASYLSDEGYASSTVTGGQFTITLTGDRHFDDEAQNYIFGDAVMYKWGAARETQLRIARKNGTIIEWDVTLAKITDGGGEANAVSAISVEIHGNGKPRIIGTDALEG